MKYWFYPTQSYNIPEQKLARAKILQMLRDLNKADRITNEKMMARMNAEKLLNTAELDDWCEMANISPEKARKAAKRVMEHGYQFQAPPGKGSRFLERQKYRMRMESIPRGKGARAVALPPECP